VLLRNILAVYSDDLNDSYKFFVWAKCKFSIIEAGVRTARGVP
jgi:hypothetical protein